MNTSEVKEYSKGLVNSIKRGKLTLEEAIIESSTKTGCTKDYARKILNDYLKSGYSNNPDYVGDWFGKGQIDFNAIINPEDSGDIYMVKMWSGSGYVLDVYLCKATNIYDAMDIVFNWSWEHEGENNIVFDFDYVRNEAAEYYKSDPDMFDSDLDEEEFEDRFISEYYVSNDYSLFARSENFFVDKVPENVLAENQKPIENSRRPIKSMAAVSKNNRMDFKSLQNMAGMYLDREGIKFTENNKGLHVDQFGDIIITAEPAGKTNRSEGRYSIELIADVETGDTFALFENAENDYYEGDNIDGFQEDIEDIVREIFALGRDNVPFIAKDMAADYETDDIDAGYQFMLDAYPEFKVFTEGRYVDSSRKPVKFGCNGKSKKGKKRPVKSGLLDKANEESIKLSRSVDKNGIPIKVGDFVRTPHWYNDRGDYIGLGSGWVDSIEGGYVTVRIDMNTERQFRCNEVTVVQHKDFGKPITYDEASEKFKKYDATWWDKDEYEEMCHDWEEYLYDLLRCNRITEDEFNHWACPFKSEDDWIDYIMDYWEEDEPQM